MTSQRHATHPFHCYAVGDRIETKQAIFFPDGVIAENASGLVVDLCGPLQILVRLDGRSQAIRLSKQMVRLRA